MQLPTRELFSIRIVSAPFGEAVREITDEVERRTAGGEAPLRIITGNPEMVMLARREKAFLGILRGKDRLVVPDGVGIILAGKILGSPYRERIAGYDLMEALLSIAAKRGWRIFFLGSTPETIETARMKVRERYPNLKIDVHHGYFAPEEEEKILGQIRALRPHLLFAGLGVPKQEHWLEAHLPQLPVQLGMGVGGSFDVLAGKVKRAPLLWQRLGVEWLYRLIQEPWRWKRMMVLPRFLLLVIGHKLLGVNPLNRS